MKTPRLRPARSPLGRSPLGRSRMAPGGSGRKRLSVSLQRLPGPAFTPSALMAYRLPLQEPPAPLLSLGWWRARVGLYLLVSASGYRSWPGLVTDKRPSSMRTAPLLWLPPLDPTLVPTSHPFLAFLNGLCVTKSSSCLSTTY